MRFIFINYMSLFYDEQGSTSVFLVHQWNTKLYQHSFPLEETSSWTVGEGSSSHGDEYCGMSCSPVDIDWRLRGATRQQSPWTVLSKHLISGLSQLNDVHYRKTFPTADLLTTHPAWTALGADITVVSIAWRDGRNSRNIMSVQPITRQRLALKINVIGHSECLPCLYVFNRNAWISWRKLLNNLWTVTYLFEVLKLGWTSRMHYKMSRANLDFGIGRGLLHAARRIAHTHVLINRSPGSFTRHLEQPTT